MAVHALIVALLACGLQFSYGRPDDKAVTFAPCNAMARCFADPCQLPLPSSCPSPLPKTATCHANYCVGGRYRGQVVNTCGAVWIDSNTGSLLCGNFADEDASTSSSSDGVAVGAAGGSSGSGGGFVGGGSGGGGADGSSGSGDKECVCAEIYQPVCATAANKTYGNACEAKCAGVTVTEEGACANESEPRACILLYSPVCAAGIKTYGNGCFAAAAGVTESKPGACGSEDGDGGDGDNGPVVLQPCDQCTKDQQPVCGTDGRNYVNPCRAECKLGKGAFTEGLCEGTPNPFDCIGNVRCALDPCAVPPKCAAVVPDAICLPNYCTGQEWNGQPFPACSALWLDSATNEIIEDCPPDQGEGGDKGDGDSASTECACDDVLQPVCATAANKTYSNSCQAKCAGVSIIADGACPVEQEPRACNKIYAPVCAAGVKTYGNGCEAAAAGATELEPGECGAATKAVPWDECPPENAVNCFADPCSVLPEGCEAPEGTTCVASYCSNAALPDGTRLPDCAAVFVGRDGSTSTCPAVGSEQAGVNALVPYDECPPENAVYCFANPCSVLPEGCEAPEGSTCVASYCSNAVLPDGTRLPDCAAVFVGRDGSTSTCPAVGNGISRGGSGGGSEKADAKALVPYDECPPENAVYCFANPCSVLPEGCEAPEGTTCVASYCSNAALPDGTPLAPCAPVFVARDGTATTCPAGDVSTEADDDVTVVPYGSCPADQTVMCFADPCSVLPEGCEAPTGSTCVASYCSNAVLPDGTPVGPCAAVFVSKDGTVSTCSATSQIPFQQVKGRGAVKPGGEPCVCNTLWEPVCGQDGVTYSNACAARCAKVAVKSNGECGGKTKALPSCSADARVSCKADPCAMEPKTCTAAPTATCQSNYCQGVQFHGRRLTPCQAVWVDRDGTVIDDCGAVASSWPSKSGWKPSGGCPKSKIVECFANPCDVTRCPAHPDATCLANYCSVATFFGRPVGPCEAVFVDGSGRPVDCTAGGSEPSCDVCTADYKPVCTTDGKTYPNRCSAECSGKTVRRDGKCGSCKGRSCKSASAGEVCRLGSKQCGKQLTCERGSRAGSGELFGTCKASMKVVRGGHRRNLLE